MDQQQDRKTIERRVRASIWKLLLPLPLAVALVVLVGVGGRRAWYTTPAPSLRGSANIPARSGDHQEAAPQPSAPEQAAPAPSIAPAPEPFSAPAAAAQPPVARTPSRPRISPPVAAVSTHSFRPAPETVAHPHEAALRASEPPPAVPSALKMAPAPVVSLVPAPEPQARPQTAGGPQASPMQPVEPRRQVSTAPSVRAVRFDASYYYSRGLPARDLAEELTKSWAEQGVNLVYFYAYNRVYGARYRTQYAGNVMEDFGRQDLLRHVLREAHRRNIKVVAWIQGVQHKQMWEAHPSWRQKNTDRTDYKPDADSYFLCVRNPEVMQWWLGLLDDLFRNYPDLDGLDMAEFQLDLWGDHACHCEHCRSQFAQTHPGKKAPSDTWRQFRAEGLTRVIQASARLAHGYNKEVHVTTVFTASTSGKLMTAAQVRDAIGFDLEGVLRGADRPDVVQAELIWQQWAALYHDRTTFTPEWTKSAVLQAKDMLRGRAKLIAHVEVTDFGAGALDGPRLARTIASAAQARPLGIDIYDAHLLAQTEGSAGYLQTAWLNP